MLKKLSLELRNQQSSQSPDLINNSKKESLKTRPVAGLSPAQKAKRRQNTMEEVKLDLSNIKRTVDEMGNSFYEQIPNSVNTPNQDDGIANQFLNKLTNMNKKVKIYKQVFYSKEPVFSKKTQAMMMHETQMRKIQEVAR